MAKFFKPGDFRAGYYRDQTFMFASGLATIEQFFSQLYADADVKNDPFSAGRQMNAHFATKMVNENGEWLDLVNLKNVSSDIAPTAGQMPRALGLAFASKVFRNVAALHELKHLSNNGNEVCFCTIGDASTSEGHFWEAMNAAGVLQIPLADRGSNRVDCFSQLLNRHFFRLKVDADFPVISIVADMDFIYADKQPQLLL